MKDIHIEDLPDICDLCNLPMVECGGHNEDVPEGYEEDMEESL